MSALFRAKTLEESKTKALTKPHSPNMRRKGDPYKATPINPSDSQNWLKAIAKIITLSRMNLPPRVVIEEL